MTTNQYPARDWPNADYHLSKEVNDLELPQAPAPAAIQRVTRTNAGATIMTGQQIIRLTMTNTALIAVAKPGITVCN